jgi:hypothetical protein
MHLSGLLKRIEESRVNVEINVMQSKGKKFVVAVLHKCTQEGMNHFSWNE